MIILAEARLATMHYDSALRPQRYGFATPNVVIFVNSDLSMDSVIEKENESYWFKATIYLKVHCKDM